MKSIKITVQDFTGVYAEQPFMQGLRKAASTDGEIRWFDCTRIDGTDCYCDDEAQAILRKQITEASSISTPSIHFFDNGNYHYMSKLWTDSIREPFDLVVFDHHPDMQPPRFEGILSCGGWIKEVLEHNKFVQKVIVIGVADHLVEEIQQEIASHPSGARNDVRGKCHDGLLAKVTFIRESELTAVTLEGRSPDRVHLTSHTTPVYISIDKDALNTQEAATNWDQGSLSFEQLAETLQALAQNRKILGIDICGERARDMGFEDTTTADSLNNALNKKLFHLLTGLHGIQ